MVKMTIRKCIICGAMFSVDKYYGQRCPECKYKRKKEYKPDPIIEDAKRAKSIGLTYGEYKAKQYLGWFTPEEMEVLL